MYSADHSTIGSHSNVLHTSINAHIHCTLLCAYLTINDHVINALITIYRMHSCIVFDWKLELERVRESQLCYSDAHYL